MASLHSARPANQPSPGVPGEGEELRLTDFMDLPTLQEIQDSFAAIANVKAVITDAKGNLLTSPTPTPQFLRRQQAIEAEIVDGPQKEGTEYVAPITVNNQRLGQIRMTANSVLAGIDEGKLSTMAERYGIDVKQLRSLAGQVTRAKNTRPAAIQFLFLLANAVARLCFQEFQLRQRLSELTAVTNVTIMLSEARDLPKVLQRTVEVVANVMSTKASSIRLLDAENDDLVIKAVYNLSPEYLNKGPIPFSRSAVDREAMSEKGFAYVANMATDPRTLYPQESTREGIVSFLSVGMRYKGRAIGALRVYTDTETHFTQLQVDLIKAIAAQAAAAIENARLQAEAQEADALERQVRMAADVQQRMVPQTPPIVKGVDLAAVYVPCFELGGDFYDFIPLPGDNVGLVVADVAGKGVPASLIMASVRAFLRAQVDNVYYLYEVIRRTNAMLCRDTKPSEFVTLIYGVLDTRTRRFTWCNAGHPPGLLLRKGEIIELPADNMVLGVEMDEAYRQSFMELQKGDVLLLYTDGLPDAMNFQHQTFGRQRVVEALKKATRDQSADTIAQNILWEMRRFVGLCKRCDDVTMIVAKIT